jgi:hypothetical protein
LVGLTLGAGIGLILSTLTVVLVGGIAFAAIVLLHAVAQQVPSRWVVIVAGLFMVAAGSTPFTAAGWVSGWTTAFMGRLGNNRNKAVTQALSVLSAGLAVAIFGGLAFFFRGEIFTPWLRIQVDGPEFGLVYTPAAALAAAVAMGVAGYVAARRVEADKFCEACRRFMPGLRVKSLRLGSLRALARAANEGNAEVFACLLDTHDGEDGVVDLFRCPLCGKGIIEATARFKAKWPGTSGGRKTESWLVASLELSPAEVSRVPISPRFAAN